MSSEELANTIKNQPKRDEYLTDGEFAMACEKFFKYQLKPMFVAFKKDYDNEIHVPNRIIKQGKFVERAKILLSDYVFVPQKQAEEIVAMIDKQMDSATNLIPCKAPCARDVENTYIKIKELLEK